MRFDGLFNDIDKKTAQWLSEDYPVLKDEQKERLYAMSKRKYNINDIPEGETVEVSGVERYRRPKWYKFAGAAAAVVLVAGIGGSIAFISRSGNSPAAEVESSIVEATEEVTEAPTEAVTEIAEETAPAEEVDAKLHGIMKNIYKACVEAAEEAGKPGNLAVGANVAGFLKVADAMVWQGTV